MASDAPHKRMQSSTRMDVLTMMLSNTAEKASSGNDASPRDSLSPLDEEYPLRPSKKQTQGPSPSVVQEAGVQCSTAAAVGNANAGIREAQTEQVSDTRNTFQQQSEETHEAVTDVAPGSPGACSPRGSLISRTRRPADLHLNKTNGLSTDSISTLKQSIRSTSQIEPGADAIVQVARPKPSRKRLPKSPVAVMGNKPSSVDAPDELAGDHESMRSVLRKPVRATRRSSANLFKRIDSKNPLPRPVTAASMLPTKDEESPVDPFLDPTSRDSAVMTPLHSGSTITVTGDLTGQPLSGATTITDSKPGSEDQSDDQYERMSNDAASDGSAPPPVPIHRSSALSPILPAPSPLREDSPHKYGLKDRMDTPEIADEPAEELTVNRARRRSNGLEIFQEAKSLQSAQSFLNSLSTSRRRAESLNRTTDTCATTLTNGTTTNSSTTNLSRPASRLLPSTTLPHQSSNNTADMDSRRRGHNFKSNGFAFSRPLTLAQIKCYRNHTRLLRSLNKSAPVECSVCHMDDDREHWSCAWCALRMCGYCRRDFAERGSAALRERIKGAELGCATAGGGELVLGGSSGSEESLGCGRRYI